MVKGSTARFGAGTNMQTANRKQTVIRTTVSNFKILEIQIPKNACRSYRIHLLSRFPAGFDAR
jgi:hypothetical protein